MKKLFHLIIIIGLFGGCKSNDSNSTTLDSDDYTSKADRIKVIKKEIKFFSDFHDAEFELFNVNGFQNQTWVPGASSWDYKFAIRIDTLNISKWTSGMQEIGLNEYDDHWTKEITKQRKQNWQTNSEPHYFIRNGENITMLVYKKEGIIFKRVINLN